MTTIKITPSRVLSQEELVIIAAVKPDADVQLALVEASRELKPYLTAKRVKLN